MRIVIVSHFFPPCSGPGAVRPHALATELTALGHDVVVITANDSPVETPFEVVSVPYSRPLATVRRLMGSRPSPSTAAGPAGPSAPPSRLTSLIARLIERTLQHPDKYVGWSRATSRWWKSEGARLAPPDLVLATSPPVTAAVVGARLASAWGCPLVLDLRDLWTESPYYRFGALRRWVDRRSESRLLAKASEVTVVTEELRRVLQTAYPALSVRLVRTGVLAQRIARKPGGLGWPRQLVIGHFGSMDDWVRRDPGLLWEAVESLVAEGLVPRGAFRFDFYGPAGDEFACSVAPWLDRGEARLVGAVSHEVALERLAECDAALLLMWSGDTHSMPMKATEYMAFGKTILVANAGAEAEVRRVLSGVEGAYFCDDPETTRRALLECWTRFSETQDLDWQDQKRAEPFLAPAMTNEFERVFRETLG